MTKDWKKNIFTNITENNSILSCFTNILWAIATWNWHDILLNEFRIYEHHRSIPLNISTGAIKHTHVIVIITIIIKITSHHECRIEYKQSQNRSGTYKKDQSLSRYQAVKLLLLFLLTKLLDTSPKRLKLLFMCNEHLIYYAPVKSRQKAWHVGNYRDLIFTYGLSPILAWVTCKLNNTMRYKYSIEKIWQKCIKLFSKNFKRTRSLKNFCSFKYCSLYAYNCTLAITAFIITSVVSVGERNCWSLLTD